MKYSSCLIALVFCLAWITPLSAQTLDSAKADIVPKARENWYWLHAGWLLVGYEAAVSVAVQHHVFKARHAVFGMTPFANVAPPQIHEVSILYGITDRGDWSFASVSAGLGYTYGSIPNEPPSFSRTNFDIIGLAFEAHASLKAYAVGFGISVIGNLNLYQSYVGLAVTAHLGWLP